MRRFLSFVAIAGLALLTLQGCSNPNVDTAKVRAVLEPSLTPAQKTELETALTDIDAGKFKEAMLPLRHVAASAKLDKKQAKLLDETVMKVRAKIDKGQ